MKVLDRVACGCRVVAWRVVWCGVHTTPRHMAHRITLAADVNMQRADGTELVFEGSACMHHVIGIGLGFRLLAGHPTLQWVGNEDSSM